MSAKPGPLSSAGSPRVIDLAIEEVPDALMERLRAMPVGWFSSADFCTMFHASPARRARIVVDDAGNPVEAVYYRTEGRLFARVHVFGPPSLTGRQVSDLLKDLGARAAHVWLMPAPVLPDTPGAWWQPRGRTMPMTVVDLPRTAGEYLARLGPRTRKHLPYYERRLRREWPDAEMAFHENGQITPQMVEELVALNRARIESRGGVHGGFEGDVLMRRARLAARSGLMLAVRRAGRLVGGTLCYIHRQEAFLALIGHDPQYDRLNLGNVCLWLTVQRLIDRGIGRFNLLWGASFYKQQFGGVAAPAYEIRVCRGPLSACFMRVLTAGDALRLWARRAINFLRRAMRGATRR